MLNRSTSRSRLRNPTAKGLLLADADLNISFDGGQGLDSRITFSRASPASRINSSGAIESVGNNVARFDFDPVSREPKGLLIEEARTNLLLNSETLATQVATVTAAAHTLSFYGTGTVTLSGAHDAVVAGSGAFPTRTTLTFTPTAGALTLTVAGSVKWANLELGAFATSWVPTAGATVQRLADTVTMTGTNFSDWYTQAEGTFLFVGSSNSVAADSTAFAIEDATTLQQNMIDFRFLNGTLLRARVRSANTNSADLASPVIAVGSLIQRSLGAKLNDFASGTAGFVTNTDVAGAMPATSMTRLTFGARGTTVPNSVLHVKQFAYWGTRLQNTDVAAISA